MKGLNKLNSKNISLILSYLTISSYIILGNCMTFNIGNRMPIKLAEIIAFISCIVLIIIHKKDVFKVDKENIKIVLWFGIATIPMFFYGYEIKHILYGLLYSARIIATLAVAVVITNVFKKYDVSRDKICKYFINNYLIVCFIGIFQLIFFPFAYDFYNIFYKIGVYFTNPDPHIERLISTYFDPNFLAACIIIPTILSLDFYSRTGENKYLIKFAIFVTTIVLTVSRSGTAGLCLALFIYAVYTIRIKDKKIVKDIYSTRAFVVMILVAIIFIFLTLFTNVKVFKRILNSAEDESTYARFADWTNGVTIMGDSSNTKEPEEEQTAIYSEGNPILKTIFGIGYNMIGFTQANSSKVDASAFGNDSSLILIYISSGIIGSMYFAYFVGTRIIKGYKERNKYKNNMVMITVITISLIICNFNNLLFYILWLFPIFVLLNLKRDCIEDNSEIKKIDSKKDKLIIGIDARGLDGKKAGIPTYIEKILEEIEKIDDKQSKYILYSPKKINLDIKENSKIIISEEMQKKRITEVFGYILNCQKF